MTPATLEAPPTPPKSSPSPSESEPKPYDRHRAETEPVTRDKSINGFLERRADKLEELLHTSPAEKPLLNSSLQRIQERMVDGRAVTATDRLPMPEKYQTADMNKRVGSVVEKLLKAEDSTNTLANLIVETAGGAPVEQRDMVKALGLRMLQQYAPESRKKSWRSDTFGESRRQRVRIGEILILSGQLGDLSAELQAGANGKIEVKKAQRYHERFTRYAHNHDVPASFRQNLIDMTGLLERQHPSLLSQVAEKKRPSLTDTERLYVQKRSRRSYRKWGDNYGEVHRQPLIEDIPLAAVVDEHEADTRSLIVEAGDVSQMSPMEAERRLQGFTENRADNPAREAAAQWLEGWREQDGDLGSSTLRPVFDRYSAPDPEREVARQRYLDIMQNELGYADSLKEGGLLNKLTSQWTEALYARVAINPTKPWRWFTRKGREDVMQARGDVIASLRSGMIDHNSGLEDSQRALFLELAERYEELQVRDQLKARPVRAAVASVIQRRGRGGERTVSGREKRQASRERVERRAVIVEQQRVAEVTTEPTPLPERDWTSPEDVELHDEEQARFEREEQIIVGRELKRAQRSWWQRLFGQ